MYRQDDMCQPSSKVSGGRPSSPYSSMDLQLAVLRHLPTPVLVLSPQRKIIFANRAAERMLGSRDPLQSPGTGIVGSAPADMGINLLYNRLWDVVLDRLASVQEHVAAEGSECSVHEVDAVVDNPATSYSNRHFRVLFSTLKAADGVHFILSFERSAHMEKGIISDGDEATPSLMAMLPTPGGVGRNAVGPVQNILRVKKAVFDSHDVPGFILTVDEEFYLANIKAREVLGDVMGGAEGCDGSVRTRLEIWDENFTRRLNQTEFPGMRLVRAKVPFTDYRCGFVHAVTGDKIVTYVDGECLYDDDTGEFLGGLCWCREVQEYSDFLVDQQQRRLRSHETICNLMPHLVWTTKTDGQADWFSERVSYGEMPGTQLSS